MRLLNPSSIGLVPFVGRIGYPAHSMTLLAKIVLRLRHGGVAELIDDEPALPTGNVAFADDEEALGGNRYESDFALFKPAADVIVAGSFHAPGGQPVTSGRAAVAIGSHRSEVIVFGERRWDSTLTQMSDPVPFTDLELRWREAFGGPEFPWNPAGKGHRAQALQVPRIEFPTQRVTRSGDTPMPAGFGAIPATWQPRFGCMGTFDDNWEKNRWPWFPEDFDWNHFRAAAPGLRLETYLAGNESLFFENMHALHPQLETRLPGLNVAAAVQRIVPDAGARLEAVEMRLDTLWVDVAAERIELVWRGWCPTADEEMSDLEYVWATLVDRPLEAAECTGLAQQGIYEDEAEWEIEEEIAPPDDPESEPDDADRGAVDEDDAGFLTPDLAEQLAALAAMPREEPPVLPEDDPRRAELYKQAEEMIAEREAAALEDEPREPPWDRDRVTAARAAGESLAGVDLSAVDLSSMDLRGADFTGTIMDHADLSGACLAEGTMVGASLIGAILEGADLSSAVFQEADLSGSQGSNINAEKADFSGANLAGARWPHASFIAAKLCEVDATEASFTGAALSGADMEDANFESAELTFAQMDQISAPSAIFVGADLRRARLDDADLSEADLSDARLDGCTMLRANLTDTTMERADAMGADLREAVVTGLRAAEIDLSQANLSGIVGEDPIFSDAKLTGARLEFARIPGVDLSGADLRQALLSACDLKGGRFTAADMQGCALLNSNCFEAIFENCRLLECDGSGTNFYGAEFLNAEIRGFAGDGRNLTMTKLDPQRMAPS